MLLKVTPVFPDWCNTARYLSLATLRRDGREVRTPVWFAREGDALYVFSAPEVGKVKRLRRSAECRIAPCDMRGRVAGEFTPSRGYLLNASNEIAQARQALRRKYGWQMTLTDFASRLSGRLHRRQYLVFKSN